MKRSESYELKFGLFTNKQKALQKLSQYCTQNNMEVAFAPLPNAGLNTRYRMTVWYEKNTQLFRLESYIDLIG